MEHKSSEVIYRVCGGHQIEIESAYVITLDTAFTGAALDPARMGCDGGSIPRRDEMVKLKKKIQKVLELADSFFNLCVFLRFITMA